MKLYAEILSHYLSNENAQILFPDLQLSAKEIVEMQCYQALCKIKGILYDDTLTDDESFLKIEEIICTFRELGSTGGNRHNF